MPFLFSFLLRAYPLFFYPYFFLLSASGLYHATYGGIKSIDRFFGTSVSKKTLRSKYFVPLLGAISLIFCSGEGQTQLISRSLSLSLSRSSPLCCVLNGRCFFCFCLALLAFGGVYFNVPKDSFPLWQRFFEKLLGGFGFLKRFLLPWQYGRTL
jgi:hypothetical protein